MQESKFKRVVILVEDANDLQSATLAPLMSQAAFVAGCRSVDVIFPEDPAFDLLTGDLTDSHSIAFGIDIGGLPDAPDVASRIAIVIGAMAQLVGLRTPPRIFEENIEDDPKSQV